MVDWLIDNLSFLVRCLAVLWLLKGHVDDGNVWGIWLESGRLVVGDFWASLLIVILVVSIAWTLKKDLETEDG